MEQEENKNLPAKLNIPPEQLTEQVIKAFFAKEISRKEYQEVLKNLEKVKPTTENLPEVERVMKDVAGVVKKLKQFAKDIAAPYDKTHGNILKAMTDLLSAIETKVAIINAEKNARNEELEAEKAKANAEKARIDNIKNTMVAFINNCTAFIATATSDKQIINIQKRIGTEKSKKGFYAEFMPDLIDKTAALDELIEERKLYIKKEAELSAAAIEALKNDDVEAAAEIREQQEQLETDMEENILRLQEEAFQQISNDETVYVPEPVGEALKGRNYWRWEVEDLHKLYKKRPDLVILTPNREAIDQMMAANRDQWNKEGKKDAVLDTIKFFIKKFL